MWWVCYGASKAGNGDVSFFIFWHLNLIHFKRGITVVPLFSCLLWLLSHPSKCLWEAPHLSSKIKLSGEMFKHIITFKHTILSGEKAERERRKAVKCFEASRGCSHLFRKIKDDVLVCVHICACVCNKCLVLNDSVRQSSDALYNLARQILVQLVQFL